MKSTRVFRCASVASGVILGVVTCAGAGHAVQTDLAGVVHFPDNSLSSVGNESQAGAEVHSGFLDGALISQSMLSFSRQGVDFNGTTGNASVAGMSIAEMGRLRASGGCTASSQANNFPHADAALNFGGPAVAQFWDDVRFFDPTVALGASVQARLTVQLDWTGTGLSGPNQGFATGANGFGGLDFIGNVSASMFRDSVGNVADNPGGTLLFSVANGSSVRLWGSLTIFASCRVFSVSSNQQDASASSDAGHTMNFYLDGVDSTLTAIGDSGHDYATPVPGTSAAGALALLGLVKSRRRR